MRYVQDFAKECIWTYLLPGMFWGSTVFGVTLLALWYFCRWDKEFNIERERICKGWFFLLCFFSASYILYRQQTKPEDSLRGFLMLLYFLICSVTDYYMKQVYDGIQLGVCALISGGILHKSLLPSVGVDMIAYALIMVIVFQKMFGEADAMCFLICALSLIERGIFVWLCHMGISFLLLGIVQGYKHNIASDGNLKAPVPFFPYMAVAYLFVF